MKKYILCLIGLLLFNCCLLLGQNTPTTKSVNDQRKFDYYFYEALNAKALGKFDAALDNFKFCYEIDSLNANLLYELGNYYRSADKQSKALNCYQKATLYDNNNFYYALAYASICFELKQYTEAIEQYETLIKKSPDNADLYLFLSEANRLDGNISGAVTALDRLEAIIGLNEKVSLQKFQLYSLLKQENKAFSEMQKYIVKYPNEIKYQILLGNLYLKAGKTKDAFMTFSQAKAIDPEDPYLISSLSAYYEETGNKAAAEDELRTALLSHKMDVDSKLGILTQYITTLQQNQKDTQKANALFDTLMMIHPQEPKLNFMYANLLILQDRKDDARFQFQIFAESEPTNPVGWEQMLATTFPDSVDLTIQICKTALSYLPEQPQFYFYQGLSQYIQKDYSSALHSLLAGAKYVDPENVRLLSDFYGQIGDTYQYLGMTDSAFVSYDKALSYNPANIGILNNYSYFLSLEKRDLSKAEKMSGMTIKAEPTNPTYLDTYGWVLFQQGVYTMAKMYIEKAVQYSEEKEKTVSAEVLEHYGDVLYKTGETETALEYWEKAKKTGESDSKTLDIKIESKTYIEE